MAEEVAPNEELDVNYASQLFLQSYKHSQGAPGLHDHILYYYAERHPNWSITDDQLKEIKRNVIGSAVSVNASERYPHVRSDKDDVDDDVVTHLTTFQEATNKRPAFLKHDERIKFIANFIKERDTNYLLKGRPNRKGTSSDPYFSFFQHYVVEKHSTGYEELDLMYKEVGEYFDQNDKWSADYLKKLYKNKHSNS